MPPEILLPKKSSAEGEPFLLEKLTSILEGYGEKVETKDSWTWSRFRMGEDSKPKMKTAGVFWSAGEKTFWSELSQETAKLIASRNKPRPNFDNFPEIAQHLANHDFQFTNALDRLPREAKVILRNLKSTAERTEHLTGPFFNFRLSSEGVEVDAGDAWYQFHQKEPITALILPGAIFHKALCNAEDQPLADFYIKVLRNFEEHVKRFPKEIQKEALSAFHNETYTAAAEETLAFPDDMNLGTPAAEKMTGQFTA